MRNFTYLKKFSLENKNKIIKVLGLGIIILFSILYIASYNFANSGASDNISGFAWGAENNGGMGWLSFNDGGGSVNYGVTIDTTNGSTKGDITGYAWAGNSVDSSVNGYGWLKFGGLSGIQIRPGIISEDAKFAGNSNNLTGWARFCAVYQSGCSGNYYHGSGPVNNNLSTNPYLGGWDGWVSLSGTSPDYGVKLSGDTFSGYAWGGDVVGWISFNCATGGNCLTVDYKVKRDAVAVPSVTITSSPPIVYSGNSFTISWDGTNLNNNNCQTVAEKNNQNWASSGWPTSKPSSDGDFVEPSSPLPIGDYKYEITCTGQNGAFVSNSVTVNVINNNESVTLKYTPVKKDPLSNKYTTTLSWVTKDIKNVACVASSSPLVSSWSGYINPPSDRKKENVSVPSGLDTSYFLTCTGLYSNKDVISNTLKLNEKSGRQGPKWEWE